MQSICILLFAVSINSFLYLKAATQDSANYALGANPNENGNVYSTGVISGTGPYTMNGTGTLRLAGINTFSGGVYINSSSAAAILGLGYPPASLTTTINSSGNSYMGASRTIRFGTDGGGGTNGGILELGCDMSNANCTLRSRTSAAIGATIRGYNQTSAYTIRFSTYLSGVQAGGPINIGAGATVIFGFALPVGSSGTNYSAFNVSGTSTNSGTLRLFNGASSSTAAAVNAYGILDMSLCTTQFHNALSTGTLTVRSNGTLRLPSATGTFSKAIVLSP